MSHGPVPEQVYADATRHFGGPDQPARGGDHGDQRLEPEVMVAAGEQPPPIDE